MPRPRQLILGFGRIVTLRNSPHGGTLDSQGRRIVCYYCVFRMGKRIKKPKVHSRGGAFSVSTELVPGSADGLRAQATPEVHVATTPVRGPGRRWVRWMWLALGVVGVLVRLCLWWVSIGTNDVANWAYHGINVSANGLVGAYIKEPAFNHPPLLGMYAGVAWSWAHGNLIDFARLIKLPGLVGEALTLWALWRFAGLRAAATYAWLPSAILVSGFHGNTDTLMAAFVFVAAIAFDREHYLLSGLLWGMALNVKLLPMLLIPLIFISAPNIRAVVRLAIGLGVGLLLFVPLALSAPSAMYRNMLAYNSIPDHWGIIGLLNAACETPTIAASAKPLRQWYLDYGRYLILGATVLLGLVSRFRSRLPMTEQAALGAALFLILTPGFGVQYVVLVLPLLCLVDLSAAVTWGTLSGIVLAVDYWTYMISWHPPHSYITYLFLPPVPLLGMLAWAALLHFAWVHISRAAVSARLNEGYAAT